MAPAEVDAASLPVRLEAGPQTGVTFDAVETVDRLKIAQRLSAARPAGRARLRVYNAQAGGGYRFVVLKLN